MTGDNPAAREIFDQASGLRVRIAQKAVVGAGLEGAGEHHRLLDRWRRELDDLDGQLARPSPSWFGRPSAMPWRP